MWLYKASYVFLKNNAMCNFKVTFTVRDAFKQQFWKKFRKKIYKLFKFQTVVSHLPQSTPVFTVFIFISLLRSTSKDTGFCLTISTFTSSLIWFDNHITFVTKGRHVRIRRGTKWARRHSEMSSQPLSLLVSLGRASIHQASASSSISFPFSCIRPLLPQTSATYLGPACSHQEILPN